MKEKIKPILLIGGYGSVGSKAVDLLHQYYPDIPLVIAGRNPHKAKKLIDSISNSSVISVDLKRKDLGIPDDMQFSAVAAYMNDTTLHAQKYAQAKGIPYVTVAGSVAELGMALAFYVNNGQDASVVLSSQWMGGIPDALAMDYAKQFRQIDSIKITAINDPLDEFGEGSDEEEIKSIFIINPYSIAIEDGIYKWLKTDKEKKYRVRTIDGSEYDAYSFPIADILSLENGVTADSIKFYTAEGKSYGTKQSKGVTHDIIIEMSGIAEDGKAKILHTEIIYPKGQAHMTALGSIIALEQVMGLMSAVKPNIYLGANLLDISLLKRRLEEQGAFYLSE
ncbi:hypothetical protein [Bacteroides sp.]|uniref:hypothetical protein n=1 Tax=Bacteroides sp. TaxID=29523 RepID=UPI0025C2B2B6|nr:hypothetical protein [Bacteroides sp.]